MRGSGGVGFGVGGFIPHHETVLLAYLGKGGYDLHVLVFFLIFPGNWRTDSWQTVLLWYSNGNRGDCYVSGSDSCC